MIFGEKFETKFAFKTPFTRGRETRARADGGKEEEKKKKKKKKTMDPLPTTASLKRDVQWALLGSTTTGRQSSSVLEKRIQSAVDAVAFCALPTTRVVADDDDDSDDDSDEEEEEEEELAKIETLAQFFYQCASVDLTPRGFDERLDVVCGGDDENVNDDIVRSIPTETKRALRDAYVKNKTRLTRACRNLAEMEDEKTMERIEKVEWRMDVETSSRMRQNRGGGGGGEGDDIVGDRLRYVVKVTLRRLNENYVAERRVDVFECSYDALKKLSEEVEKCLEKSEDARAKRIRRFVRRPTT